MSNSNFHWYVEYISDSGMDYRVPFTSIRAARAFITEITIQGGVITSLYSLYTVKTDYQATLDDTLKSILTY